MKKIFITLFFVSFIAVANTVQPTQITPLTTDDVRTLDHSQWDALLHKYVSASGNVNYKGFFAKQK